MKRRNFGFLFSGEIMASYINTIQDVNKNNVYPRTKVDAISDSNEKGLSTLLLEKVDKTVKVNGHALDSDVIVTKADIQLGEVDNTSDLNKPISSATQEALSAESSARASSDAAIQSEISEINSKIPYQASSENQLADKQFVNSSISTETATFRGTSAMGLTEEQFLSWANSLTKTKNDYVFWNTVDTTGNTLYKKYKYDGTSWIYEYTLNNSSFTATQWASVNSGITTEKVSELDLNSAARHTHANKELLDTYTQTEINLSDAVSKKHEHSNKAILDAILLAPAPQLTTYTKTEVDAALLNKVDKVSGKGLSTNDYDATEKQKVADAYSSRHSHSNKEILDAISEAPAPQSSTYTKGEVDSSLSLKQNCEDSSLETSSKSVVGSINELKSQQSQVLRWTT